MSTPFDDIMAAKKTLEDAGVPEQPVYRLPKSAADALTSTLDPTNKEKLRNLCRTDPTVLAAFRLAEQNSQPYEEMLEGLTVMLAEDKERLLKQWGDALAYSTKPPTMAIPTENLVLQLGLWEWIKFKLFKRSKL